MEHFGLVYKSSDIGRGIEALHDSLSNTTNFVLSLKGFFGRL